MGALLQVAGTEGVEGEEKDEDGVAERPDDHGAAGDGGGREGCEVEVADERGLACLGGELPERFAGDDEGGDDADGTRCLVLKEGANLLDPAADKGESE